MGETYYEAGKRDGHLALLIPNTGDLFGLWRFTTLEIIVESLDVWNLWLQREDRVAMLLHHDKSMLTTRPIMSNLPCL